MKLLHYFAWLAFIITLGLAVYKDISLNIGQGLPYNPFGLQLAGKAQGKDILQQWSHIPTAQDTTLLKEAEYQTRLDYIFLLAYTSLLIILSYQQMQKVQQKWLNNLLRFNFPLAIITGLLNAVGNAILLADMQPWRIGSNYTSIQWLSYAKFGLGAWIVLVLILSLIRFPPGATRQPL